MKNTATKSATSQICKTLGTIAGLKDCSINTIDSSDDWW